MSSKLETKPGAYVQIANYTAQATATSSSLTGYPISSTALSETYNNLYFYSHTLHHNNWYLLSFAENEPATKKDPEKMEKKSIDDNSLYFEYKSEKLYLGTYHEWEPRLGIFDYAELLLTAQLDNGGYLTEHAWGACIRRAESDLKEAAKGVMALAAWLSGCTVKSDLKLPVASGDLIYFNLTAKGWKGFGLGYG